VQHSPTVTIRQEHIPLIWGKVAPTKKSHSRSSSLETKKSSTLNMVVTQNKTSFKQVLWLGYTIIFNGNKKNVYKIVSAEMLRKVLIQIYKSSSKILETMTIFLRKCWKNISRGSNLGIYKIFSDSVCAGLEFKSVGCKLISIICKYTYEWRWIPLDMLHKNLNHNIHVERDQLKGDLKIGLILLTLLLRLGNRQFNNLSKKIKFF
jgi:hypothetical protein